MAETRVAAVKPPKPLTIGEVTDIRIAMEKLQELGFDRSVKFPAVQVKLDTRRTVTIRSGKYEIELVSW